MGNENACGVCWRDPMKADGCGVAVVYIDGVYAQKRKFYRGTYPKSSAEQPQGSGPFRTGSLRIWFTGSLGACRDAVHL